MSDEKHYLSNGSDAAKKTPGDALEFARKAGAKMVDLKFTDLLGTWQHVSLPLSAIDEDSFEEGLGFDGSSIRGWKGIAESDMLLMPDPSTAMLDPFTEVRTLSLLCGIEDPLTREPYARDPRHIAKKAEAYLAETGIADTVYFGPEAEFFVFDDVRFELSANRAFYYVDCVRGDWNGRATPASATRSAPKDGFFPRSPPDTLAPLRTEMMARARGGSESRSRSPPRVATGGQCEIGMKFIDVDPHGRPVDDVQVRRPQRRPKHAGKTATFMPKPLFGDNGSEECAATIDLEGRTSL